MSDTVVDRNIVGSWHNSGYHGHFRSRVRNDFLNEFRARAKPTPPQRYVERAKEPVRKHLFTRHDNKEKYRDSALYFVDGNGRRRVHSSAVSFKPEFIAWMPHKAELLDKRQPLTSVYRLNFHSGTKGYAESPYRQQYSNKIVDLGETSKLKSLNCNEEVYTDGYKSDPTEHFLTSYRKGYCTKDARDEETKIINTLTTRAANSQRIERARSVRPSVERETVASCLSWTPHRPYTSVPESFGADFQPMRKYCEATPIIAPTGIQALPHVKPATTVIANPVVVC